MSGIETIALIAGLAGSAASAVGTIAAGNQAAAGAEFEAAQLDAAADEEKAASQREAMQKRKERDFVLSRQQAVASQSNLGALDETVLDLAGDVVQEGAVQEGMIRYGGDQRASGRRAQAQAARISGKAAKTGSYLSAAGTIMGGIGSFASDFSGIRKPSSPSYSYRYQ
jgi:pyruvate/2-oxoglutarate dehydrogenase complex dihydrolipoamide acyltransferase (E2) component